MARTDVTEFRVSLDSKRRPTLPVALLRQAGLEHSHELVAHVDGPGRLVLEDPDAALVAFQDEIAAARVATGFEDALDQDLLYDRASDGSLT